MYITQFGGYTFPADQLDMSESAGSSRRANGIELGGAGGQFDNFGSGPNPLAADRINKSLILDAATPALLQTAFDSWLGEMMLSQNDWRQGARALIATLPDGTQRATWAKCVDARAVREYFNVNEPWLQVQATFERAWPVWLKLEDLVWLGDHLGTFQEVADAGHDFGQNVTEQALTLTSTSFTITNGGNARVMDGLLEFEDQMSVPILTNTRNGHTLTYNDSLAAGDRLTVNLANFEAKLNGSDGQWSDFVTGTSNGQLLPMVLEPGANPMTLATTGLPDGTFRFYWGRTYAG